MIKNRSFYCSRCEQLTEDLLKSLWLQRLQVQTILTISTDSLSNLWNIADKIHEVIEVNSVTAVNALKQCTCQSSNSFSMFEL